MTDLVIHGAGIFGLTLAWTCLNRGAQVTVVDPQGPGSGASGGLVGALAPHTPENWNDKKALQFQSLEMAEATWAEVAATARADPGYARPGRLQPLPDDRAVELARAREAGANEHWQGRYRWQVIADSEAPVLSPTGIFVYDDLSARLHPRRAIAALVTAVQALGGQLQCEPDGASGIPVWATGAAGLESLSQEVGVTVGNGVKGQAALLDCDLRDMPQIFADGLHIIPHSDGTTAIGSTSERSFDDPSSTDAQLDALVAKARHWCPALADAPVIERWAGLRPRARSRAPMIGPHPTEPGAFIANGGFKIGFGMAPICAALLADLILEGRDAIPDSFRPEASLPATALRRL